MVPLEEKVNDNDVRNSGRRCNRLAINVLRRHRLIEQLWTDRGLGPILITILDIVRATTAGESKNQNYNRNHGESAQRSCGQTYPPERRSYGALDGSTTEI